MTVRWTGGTFTWTGDHPDVGAKRKRRCRLGFTDDELVMSNRGFVLAIPLATMRTVHYVKHPVHSTLRFTTAFGVDITLRESSKTSLNSTVLWQISQAIPES